MTPLAAAFVAMLTAEGVARPVAEARAVAVVAACEQAVAGAAGTSTGPPSLARAAGGVGRSIHRCAAVAFVESRLVEDVLGDHGHAMGAWQIHADAVPYTHDACGTGASPLVYADGACIAVALLDFWERRCGAYRAEEAYHRGRCARPGAYQRRVRRIERRLMRWR